MDKPELKSQDEKWYRVSGLLSSSLFPLFGIPILDDGTDLFGDIGSTSAYDDGAWAMPRRADEIYPNSLILE